MLVNMPYMDHLGYKAGIIKNDCGNQDVLSVTMNRYVLNRIFENG